jgi:hypothetical protein
MDHDSKDQIDEESGMHNQSSQQKYEHSAMNSSAIAGHCPCEIEDYRSNKTHDDQYYLEMFHHALANHEPEAWELLQQCFSPLVRSWIRNHPQRNLACRYELEEHFVANTFTRVWQVSMRNRLEFDSLVAALSYMKISLQGTILDTLRAHTHPREVPLPNADSATISSEKQVIKDEYKSSDLWESIKCLLHDDRERRLAYLLFHCGLKPREIVCYHSAEIGEVQEIILLTRNIMERLIDLRD